MLGDAQLDACESQVRSFRMMNGQYYETLQDILRKYESLVEDYRMLRSDYEEEKENREKYKRQARGQEKNPFVLLLVDGDGYTFKDHLIKNGREGGVNAAQLLATEIRDRLRKIGSLDHCRVVVRIYSNFASISHVLSRQSLVGAHARSIAPLAAAFTGTKGYFDYVDAGENSDNVFTKIEETFRLFAEAGQCKHIFFAGCHDTRYIPLLSPYLGKADKITLIKAPAHQPEYHSLDLPVEKFSSVFRDAPLPGWTPSTAATKGAASKPTLAQPEPVNGSLKERSNGATSKNEPSGPSSLDEESLGPKPCPMFVRKHTCKFGRNCKFSHPQPGFDSPQPPQIKTKSKESWRDGNAFADDWGNNTPEPPAYGDDWGASSKKPAGSADDWDKGPRQRQGSAIQSKFAGDWREGPRPSTAGFSEDWGNGPQQNTRNGSVSSTSLPPYAKRQGSISELSMGSRHQEETKPHPAEVLRSKWASDTPEPPKAKDTMPPPERPGPKKFTSAFTTAADLPRPTPETEGLIPVNKYGDRLDFYLPRPTAEEYSAYNAMAKEPGRKPCNSYQLRGHCPSLAAGMDCEFDHNPLSSDLFHVLKVIVQGYPCPKQGACRKSDCYNGHVCQRPGCRGMYPCKFKGDYRAHNLDPKVAEWVPAVDIAEREADDASSVTMGDEVPEAAPRPAAAAPLGVKAEAEEWHPEAAAWNPDVADQKPQPTMSWKPNAAEWKPEATATTATPSFDLNKGIWKPDVPSWNPTATVWKSGDIDRSDIDSDTDSVAPQPEKEILDLGADDNAVTSIFSPKARDGRFDSVVQTVAAPQPDHAKPLVDTSTAQANGGVSNGSEPPAADQQQQAETNLMDDDWGNPPDGAGMTFAETAEPVNFDDDWGSAPPGVDNPTLADETVDFADDWGPSNKTTAGKPQPHMAPRQQNHGGQMNNNQSRPVW
ncbi:zinc finger ccch-type protein [Diplodia corticola]|uniref:Zinc finger ccch-type protein n=1 Tax=Diplodia corticola TaxID=236234 RepID=A0A1J9QQK3_9PEZI|nr:zinc finger ccch-type protein [Diplodia corticola]OJD30736.1 zinc finger ccch-type protein [Diplodia corticola]